MDATPSGSRTTRRAFVKTAGALGVGLYLAGAGKERSVLAARAESGAAERGTEGGHGGGGGRDEVALVRRRGIGLVSELLKAPGYGPVSSLRKPGKPTMNARM